MHADRLLVQALRAGPGWTALLVAATLLNAVCALALPAAIGAVTDAVLARDAGRGAGAPLGWLAAALGGVALGTALSRLAEVYCGTAATRELRTRLVTHVLALGVPGTRAFTPGDLASRAVTGAPQAGAVARSVVSAVAGLLMSVGGVVALWLIDWRLVAAVGGAVPIGLLLMRVFVRDASDLVTEYQEAQGEIAARMTDALTGIRTIRAAGTWRREADRVLAPLPGLSDSGRRLWHAYGRMQGQGRLIVPLAEIAALAVAGRGVLTGRLSAGEMLAAAGYAPMALGLVGQIPLLLALARLRAGARRLAEVLSVPAPGGGDRALPPGPGALVLRGVTVRTPDGPLLDAVDLTVPPGRTVAVVGRSGAGKTTLAAVAGRLLDPDEGRVLLDGVPLRELAPAALRAQVAYAFERPDLQGTTIADAIAYGCPSAPPRAVERAAALARADGFVRLLPAGFDTPVADTPLSGGERQRLGLARAFVRNARLIILDDATSSLDSVTEAQVAAALAEAAATRTRLVVAHRAGTAARADLVLWLDSGRVRALRPHRELWADPDYRAMFEPAPAERA
ncbi:ABC transporter ATP-binding protein [Actinomadura namibiensis]|uniref:ABC-transporter n=1 Tax=Actinomadura namibiensis TaxID=182080 RepID=C0MP61_ACTNM|nr:ABC transporter ATP-binding protein [Actinomadura namibiensis]MBA8951848.1 ATP-binding cassette subfamily B protein [Actinomadura namibiensis]CAX48974.1 ABC-transporter [Actinomadura namibiensis]